MLVALGKARSSTYVECFYSTPVHCSALPSAVVAYLYSTPKHCSLHLCKGGRSCGGNGVAILANLSIASPLHLHNHCVPNNASRSSWRTQMCPDDVVVVVKKDGDGKLEAPPS
eukprot:6800145-Ditylum_brightwellii.AAC.1